MNIEHDYKLMKNTCLRSIQSFKSFGDVYDTPSGIYIYKNNPEAKILGVAHLDSVLDLRHFHKINIKGRDIVINAQLDDRLGVYTLLYILPSLGIEFDLLLTEGEETCQSTAQWFESYKEYNWMFSFDRHGEDVVFYQYDSPDICKDVSQVKLKPGIGSLSDIAFLDHLKIKGMNIGTGYEGEHTDLCYAEINALNRQIVRFKKFYDLFKDKKYTYIPSITNPYGWKFVENTSNRFDYDDSPTCYLCNTAYGEQKIKEDIWLCNACFGQAEQCPVCQEIVYADEIINGMCFYCRKDMLKDE